MADPLFDARGTWTFVADVGVADWIPASFAARWGELSTDAKALLWRVCFNLLAEAQLDSPVAAFCMEDIFERGDVAPLKRILAAAGAPRNNDKDIDAHDLARISMLAMAEESRHNRHASPTQDRATWPQLESAAKTTRPDVRPLEKTVVCIATQMCTLFGYLGTPSAKTAIKRYCDDGELNINPPTPCQ